MCADMRAHRCTHMYTNMFADPCTWCAVRCGALPWCPAVPCCVALCCKVQWRVWACVDTVRQSSFVFMSLATPRSIRTIGITSLCVHVCIGTSALAHTLARVGMYTDIHMGTRVGMCNTVHKYAHESVYRHGSLPAHKKPCFADVCTDMHFHVHKCACRHVCSVLHRCVCRHVHRHVHGHMHGYVYGHVHRHVQTCGWLYVPTCAGRYCL